jgi:Family of unknown function (DUF6263)
MKKLLIISSVLFFLSFQALCQSALSPAKLKFDQGQVVEITMDVKTTIAQQAMGQAIDFNVNAKGVHSFKVTNATDDNTTLHHEVKKIGFSFDGMGQKRTFDSDEEKDINGPFGKTIKEIKEKPYDIIIDPNGKVLMAFPEKIAIAESDSRMALINNMLKEVLDIVQPPQKGNGSFFKVLPEKESAKGDTWTESYETATGKYNTAYSIAEINDTTIIVDFVGNAVTVTKAEMMGNETTTTMNTKSTGKVIVDKVTGIIREKTINADGTGNTETSFGTLPVTSKTTTVIQVKSGN